MNYKYQWIISYSSFTLTSAIIMIRNDLPITDYSILTSAIIMIRNDLPITDYSILCEKTRQFHVGVARYLYQWFCLWSILQMDFGCGYT